MKKIDYSLFAFPKVPKVKKEREKTSEETYNEVFKICKGKCQLCGTKKDLELHHIKGRGKGLTDNPQNCIMLCDDCHDNVVHKNQKKYRPILIKLREKLNSK